MSEEFDIDQADLTMQQYFEYLLDNVEPSDLKGFYATVIETVEQNLLTAVMLRCKGNRSHAAKLCGLSRTTLIHKIQKYELTFHGLKLEG